MGIVILNLCLFSNFYLHSNGFNAKTYGQFFGFLKDIKTQRINVLGGNIPSLNESYDSLVQEFMDNASSEKKIYGVGSNYLLN